MLEIKQQKFFGTDSKPGTCNNLWDLEGIATHERGHTFGIDASLDAGVPLRDVQEAASHADPRTTMKYDNSRELHQMHEPNASFRQLAACAPR